MLLTLSGCHIPLSRGGYQLLNELCEGLGRKPVLSRELEDALASRLIDLCERGFGLTAKSVRKFVYQYAVQRGFSHNFNNDKQMAGEDWFQSFMKRHPELSIRKAEGLSRARAGG